MEHDKRRSDRLNKRPGRTQTIPKTRGSLRADAKTTSQPATRRLPASLIHMNTLGCLGHTPRSPTLHTAGDSGSPLYRVCLSPRLRLSPSLILSFGSDFPCPRAFPCAGCGLPFRLAPYRLPPCGRSRVAASPVLRCLGVGFVVGRRLIEGGAVPCLSPVVTDFPEISREI